MKFHRASFIFLAAFSVLALSKCNRVGMEEEDYFQAFKDGKLWHGPAVAVRHENKLILRSRVLNKRGKWEEEVGFVFDFTAERAYRIPNGEGYFSIIIGGDGIASSFYSFGSSSDEVVITEYDRKNQVIRGTCSLRAGNEFDQTQIVKFISGRFRAKISN